MTLPTTPILAQLLWQSPGMMPVAAAVAAGAVAVVLWLYPPQVGALKRPWRWMMPGLRLLALAALAVCLLRPAVLRTRTVEERGAVVVLLDRSASMSVVDAGRTPAERVALAAGLGVLPAGVRDESARTARARADELTRLVEDARRARRELDYAALAGHNASAASERLTAAVAKLKAAALPLAAISPLAGVAGQVASLAAAPDDASLSAASAALAAAQDLLVAQQAKADEALYHTNEPVRRASDKAASHSRAALGAMALAQPGGVLARVPQGTPVFGFTFAGELQPLPAVTELAERNTRNATTAPATLPVLPDGTATDIAGALRSVHDRFRGRPVQAVLLCTDGRQVTREGIDSPSTTAAAAGLWASSGTPVFAIDVAGPVRKDVSVTRVSVPPRLFPSEPAVIRAELRGRGLKGQTVDVRAEAGWVEDPQMKQVTFGDDEAATVNFAIAAPPPGVHRVAVEVSAGDGEATAANNRVDRYVKVFSEKLAVMTVSGAPSWDFRYLRNALSGTPWAMVDARNPASLTSEEIQDRSVVVLSDVHAGEWSEARWTALLEFVSQRGGSILVLAGDIDVLRSYEGNAQLSGLLPYRSGLQANWRVWPGEQPAFRPVPASGAESTAMAGTWGGGPRESLGRWLQLPALYRYLAMPELKPATRVLLSERETGAPVLTETQFGAGRVLFLGVNETWRWRRGADERDQDRFWLQLLRYAAGDLYTSEADGLALDVDPVAVAPGGDVTVRAVAHRPDGNPQRVSALRLRVSTGGDGAVVADVPLRAIDGASPGRYEAVVRDLTRPGTYEVRLTDESVNGRSVAMSLHVDPGLADDAELADVTDTGQALQRLAESSGGAYVPLEQLPALPGHLSDLRGRQSETIEYPLWDSPYLFAFVLACLGGEWALRKRFGLA